MVSRLVKSGLVALFNFKVKLNNEYYYIVTNMTSIYRVSYSYIGDLPSCYLLPPSTYKKHKPPSPEVEEGGS